MYRVIRSSCVCVGVCVCVCVCHQYTERLDLEEMKSIELNSPYQRKMPVTITLRMKRDDVQLKVG